MIKKEYSQEFLDFWRTYPDRRGRKTGKKKCWKWWKRYRPDKELITAMLDWLRCDSIARRKARMVKAFYPEPKDPYSWLYNECWEDDVDRPSTKPQQMTYWRCRICGKSIPANDIEHRDCQPKKDPEMVTADEVQKQFAKLNMKKV